MLIPAGLKGKDRDKYIKENTLRPMTPRKKVAADNYPGLRQPQAKKETKVASATRQKDRPKTSDK